MSGQNNKTGQELYDEATKATQPHPELRQSSEDYICDENVVVPRGLSKIDRRRQELREKLAHIPGTSVFPPKSKPAANVLAKTVFKKRVNVGMRPPPVQHDPSTPPLTTRASPKISMHMRKAVRQFAVKTGAASSPMGERNITQNLVESPSKQSLRRQTATKCIAKSPTMVVPKFNECKYQFPRKNTPCRCCNNDSATQGLAPQRISKSSPRSPRMPPPKSMLPMPSSAPTDEPQSIPKMGIRRKVKVIPQSLVNADPVTVTRLRKHVQSPPPRVASIATQNDCGSPMRLLPVLTPSRLMAKDSQFRKKHYQTNDTVNRITIRQLSRSRPNVEMEVSSDENLSSINVMNLSTSLSDDIDGQTSGQMTQISPSMGGNDSSPHFNKQESGTDNKRPLECVNELLSSRVTVDSSPVSDVDGSLSPRKRRRKMFGGMTSPDSSSCCSLKEASAIASQCTTETTNVLMSPLTSNVTEPQKTGLERIMTHSNDSNMEQFSNTNRILSSNHLETKVLLRRFMNAMDKQEESSKSAPMLDRLASAIDCLELQTKNVNLSMCNMTKATGDVASLHDNLTALIKKFKLGNDVTMYDGDVSAPQILLQSTVPSGQNYPSAMGAENTDSDGKMVFISPRTRSPDTSCRIPLPVTGSNWPVGANLGQPTADMSSVVSHMVDRTAHLYDRLMVMSKKQELIHKDEQQTIRQIYERLSKQIQHMKLNSEDIEEVIHAVLDSKTAEANINEVVHVQDLVRSLGHAQSEDAQLHALFYKRLSETLNEVRADITSLKANVAENTVNHLSETGKLHALINPVHGEITSLKTDVAQHFEMNVSQQKQIVTCLASLPPPPTVPEMTTLFQIVSSSIYNKLHAELDTKFQAQSQVLVSEMNKTMQNALDSLKTDRPQPTPATVVHVQEVDMRPIKDEINGIRIALQRIESTKNKSAPAPVVHVPEVDMGPIKNEINGIRIALQRIESTKDQQKRLNGMKSEFDRNIAHMQKSVISSCEQVLRDEINDQMKLLHGIVDGLASKMSVLTLASSDQPFGSPERSLLPLPIDSSPEREYYCPEHRVRLRSCNGQNCNQYQSPPISSVERMLDQRSPPIEDIINVERNTLAQDSYHNKRPSLYLQALDRLTHLDREHGLQMKQEEDTSASERIHGDDATPLKALEEFSDDLDAAKSTSVNSETMPCTPEPEQRVSTKQCGESNNNEVGGGTSDSAATLDEWTKIMLATPTDNAVNHADLCTPIARSTSVSPMSTCRTSASATTRSQRKNPRMRLRSISASPPRINGYSKMARRQRLWRASSINRMKLGLSPSPRLRSSPSRSNYFNDDTKANTK